jgi:CDP-diacylglycerol pyrophosphatase
MSFVMDDASATVSEMPPNQFNQLLEEITLLTCRIAVAEEDKHDQA